MGNAIRVHEHGDAGVLRWEAVDVGAPGRGEVRVRHTAIGVNFADVYLRRGAFPVALPSGLGTEAVGVVEQVGRGVRGLKPGQRVAYLHPVPGAYAEERTLPTDALFSLPAGIDDVTAAAVFTKGLTAEFLVRGAHRVARGETILVHAAAGGVGLVLAQWARHAGATVIGVVGSEAKRELARKAGCRRVVLSTDDWPAEVRRYTRGRGVDVVYDGIGQATFSGSLDCLRPKGLLVSFGAASGPIAPFSIMELARRGSLYLTRPMGATYLSDRGEREAAARTLFSLVRRRKIRVLVGQTFALAEAVAAHRALEARATVGSTVLLP